MAPNASRQSPQLPRSPLGIALFVIVGLIVYWNQPDQQHSVEQPTNEIQSEETPSSESATSADDQRSVNATEAFLTETSKEVFRSPAGLVYRSGSADGHRLDHVMTHAEDDLSKPIHGVFHGDRDNILNLLDEAWNKCQQRGPPEVEKKVEGRRTVYTVDMGQTIGHVGGQSGQRNGEPACRKIRLVLEETDVITAYPVQ